MIADEESSLDDVIDMIRKVQVENKIPESQIVRLVRIT